MKNTDLHVISIQSQVSTGYVGNNIAGFAIQLHGLNHVMLPTVLLSSHTDKPVYYGEIVDVSLFRKLCKGIEEIGVGEQSKYVISGYIKGQEVIEATANFIGQLKQRSLLQFIYDPVFGDTRTEGLYIPREDAMYSIEMLLPLCDILTPNHFELEFITNTTISNEEQLKEAIGKHPILCNKTIVLTTAELSENVNHQVEVVLICNGKLTHYYAANVAIEVVGTGDLFTGILSSQLSIGKDIGEAIQKAMQLISSILQYVKDNQLTEMNAAAIMSSYSLLTD